MFRREEFDTFDVIQKNISSVMWIDDLLVKLIVIFSLRHVCVDVTAWRMSIVNFSFFSEIRLTSKSMPLICVLASRVPGCLKGPGRQPSCFLTATVPRPAPAWGTMWTKPLCRYLPNTQRCAAIHANTGSFRCCEDSQHGIFQHQSRPINHRNIASIIRFDLSCSREITC